MSGMFDRTTASPGAGVPPILLNGESDAVLVVNVQNDFLPTGSFPVYKSQFLLPAIYHLIETAASFHIPVISIQDWHPSQHCSFKEQGGPWPIHCVQDTIGAQVPPGFPSKIIDHRIFKATLPHKEAYSGFQGTGLFDYLKERGIERVFICGFCTEYCIKSTAMDAHQCGFDTFVIEDVVAPVVKEDGVKAQENLVDLGIQVISSKILAF